LRRYFPVDTLQHVPPSLRFTSHSCIPFAPGGETSLHPSIFIGPHGTRSALHADNTGSRFLMALFKGRKRFRLLNASDVSRCLGKVGGCRSACRPPPVRVPTASFPSADRAPAVSRP